MIPEPISPEDLQLLSDLERAARAVGVHFCLIGADALRLGPGLEWDVRPRMTKDWDFAVRTDSWSEFEALVEALTASGGGFEVAAEPHRFRHQSGGCLDVALYDELEEPDGQVHWKDGVVFETRGLSVLDEQYDVRRVGSLELRVATLPALLGLKLLAYEARRPAIIRDIGDAYRMLVEVEASVDDQEIAAQALDRLTTGEVTLAETGAYLVGREVGRTFGENDRTTILTLLDEALKEESPIVPDVRRAVDTRGHTRERVLQRLAAFRIGIVDR